MPADLIREIVADRIRERYGSLYRYAQILGVSLNYLSGVLAGRKISRPIILRIAQDLNMPELCFLYEQFLHEKKVKVQEVENKAQVSTEEKEGGNVNQEI